MPRLRQQNEIEGLIARLADPEPLLRKIGEEVLLLTEERFNTETTPDGRSWPPLDPDYAEEKQNDSILTETGQMSEQISYNVSDGRLTVGGTRPSQKDKMIAHNFGAQGPTRVPGHERTITQAFGKPLDEPKDVFVRPYIMEQNIPQRQFLSWSREYLRTVRSIALRYYFEEGGTLETR